MFKVEVPLKKKKNTIVQTIRFDGKDWDYINELSIKLNVSFNYIVNQMIKYAIKNDTTDLTQDNE